MEKAVFDKFRSLIFENCGIFLTEQKEALVSSRISKRMRALALSDYDQYFDRVVGDRSGDEMRELVNAISTNVTHFFRESRHFDFFANRVAQLAAAGQRTIKIWCAACSSGEEPYTIAMTAIEALETAGAAQQTKLQIIGSDISTKVLLAAKQGIYRANDVRTVPKPLLRKYFQQGVGRAADLYRVKQQLRDMVSYQQINLATPPYPVDSDLDAIFCRNVMIYFNQELRSKLVYVFERLLKPGGHLFVGLAESLTGLHSNLKTVEPSVYLKG